MRITTFVLAVTAAGAAGAAAPAPQPVATLTSAAGLVRVGRAGAGVFEDAKPPLDLAAGDAIKTTWGRAEIAFPDGATVRLQHDTTFEVRAPETEPQSGRTRIVSFLTRGLLRAIVKPLRADQGFEVRSASAICAVKGTDFAFDGTAAAVFDEHDDPVHAVTLSDPAGARSVVITENMTAGFGADGALGDPVPLDPAREDALRRSFEGELGPPPAGGTGEAPSLGDALGRSPAPEPQAEVPPVLAPPPAAGGGNADPAALGTQEPVNPALTDKTGRVTDDQPLVITPGLPPLCGPDHARK